jgi:pterin-4a-carbinolamine dehydratase
MSALPRWSLSDDGRVISKSFVAKNWGAALKFFNDVSAIAEESQPVRTPSMHQLIQTRVAAGFKPLPRSSWLWHLCGRSKGTIPALID